MTNIIYVDYINNENKVDTQAFEYTNKPFYHYVDDGDYDGLYLDETIAIVYDKEKAIQPIWFRKQAGRWIPTPDQYYGDEQ
jgi:hypothetical protein